jgi:RPA family protein
MMDFENLLNEFEHACRGGDYEISVCLRKEIIKKVEQLQWENDWLNTLLAAEKRNRIRASNEATSYKQQLQQAQTKAERYEKALENIVILIFPLDIDDAVAIAKEALEGSE